MTEQQVEDAPAETPTPPEEFKPDIRQKKEPEPDKRQGLPESVKVEEASAPMQLERPAPDWKGPWIQYNGVGTVRILTPQDWRAAGVDSSTRYEWNYINQKRLPRSLFSAEELQYLLRVDGRFSLVEDKKE